jgi:transcription elongation factor Elf1
MQQIINFLLICIQYQNQIISTLCVLLFGKNYISKPEKCTDKKYLKLMVDPMPVFGKPEIELIYDCAELIKSKNIKPVRRRAGKSVPVDVNCPYCGANHDYLYDNTGGRGQYQCKVCGSHFNKVKPKRDDQPYCPFCLQKLVLIKKRKNFDIYRCHNTDCPYRKKKLSAMTAEQKALFKKSPHLFKLRFIYRKFHFDFTPLSKQNEYVPIVDLPNITASPHVLGLILTYHINYGIPLRKTAALMFDVHEIRKSVV